MSEKPTMRLKGRKYPRVTRVFRTREDGNCQICGRREHIAAVDVECEDEVDDDTWYVCNWCTRIYSRKGLLWKLGYFQRPRRGI